MKILHCRSRFRPPVTDEELEHLTRNLAELYTDLATHLITSERADPPLRLAALEAAGTLHILADCVAAWRAKTTPRK